MLTYANALVRNEAVEFLQVIAWPTLAFAVVHIIEGSVLTPFIQSQQVNLSPAAILVAVAAGGAIGGIVGLIVAVPIAASLKAATKV